jgi:ribosomal protein S15P/S13E
MNMIGYRIVEQEEAEKVRNTAAKPIAQSVRPSVRTISVWGDQLATVERQIAEIKSELDQHVDDNPSLWPLRRKLVALHNKRRELTEQLQKGAQ